MWTLSSFSLARPPEAEHLKGAKRLRLVARAVESVLSEQEVLRQTPEYAPRTVRFPVRKAATIKQTHYPGNHPALRPL